MIRIRHGNLSIESRSDRLSPDALVAAVEGALVAVSTALEHEVTSREPLEILVDAGESSAVGRRIHVRIPDARDAADDPVDGFRRILDHELVHHVMECNYGLAPAILWEGLPVTLVDRVWRRRRHAFDDDAFCGLLLAERTLPVLIDLFDGGLFYGRRHDWVVDVVASSFTGHLVETHGLTAVKAAFAAYEAPTPARPVLEVTGLLMRAFGSDLGALERDWKSSLRGRIPVEREPYLKYLERRFYRRIPLRSAHCKFCFAPIGSFGGVCPSCGADNAVALRIV